MYFLVVLLRSRQSDFFSRLMFCNWAYCSEQDQWLTYPKSGAIRTTPFEILMISLMGDAN